MDPNGTFVDLGAQDIAARERSPSSRAPRSVFGDALDLARGIVPYLATLTDVVALYSCASPLRDVVAPEMLAQLSADRWQTDLTTPAMIEHVAYHGARSATACIRMQHVDISCKQPQVVTDGTDQQTADRVVEAAPVRDNELLRVAKWCHYMDTLVADRCNITDAGLYHACVCLARNDFFTRVSLRQCAPLSDLRGLALCATLRSVDCSMTNVDAAGVAPLASLPLLAELRLLRCRRLVSVDAIAGSASIELLDITACPIRSIAALGAMRSLKTLKADDTKIELLAPLRESTSLEWISLRNSLAPEQELVSLASIATLKHVCIYNANVTSVEFLHAFSTIESLDVGQLRHVVVADLSRGMPLLSRLALRFCPVVDTVYVQKLWARSLVSLDLLNATQLADDGLRGIECLAGLTYLNLAGTAVTDATVAGSVSQLTRLVHLDLSNTAVSSVAVLGRREVSQGLGPGSDDDGSDDGAVVFRALERLELECCRRVTHAGLVGLGALPRLAHLNVSCTAVRDASKMCLEPWPALSALEMRGLVRPPAELLRFARACPALRSLDLTSCVHEGFAPLAWQLRRERYVAVEGQPLEPRAAAPADYSHLPPPDPFIAVLTGTTPVKASQR